MMNDTRFLRNKDLISVDSLDRVGIIGLGGIGSFLIQSLTIMGFKTIKGWDDDTVERHNLSSTAYFVNQVEELKCIAAKKLHAQYADVVNGHMQHFIPVSSKFTALNRNSMYEKIIICTDDMESRYLAYKTWVSKHSNNPEAWFIDARMGATSIELVTVKGGQDDYMKHWIPTKAVKQAPCSMKHTVFATLNIASLVSAQVYNLVAKLAYYDYIWSSLSPINIQYGTLIVPNLNKKEIDDKSTHSKDGLGDNALGSDLLLDRTA